MRGRRREGEGRRRAAGHSELRMWSKFGAVWAFLALFWPCAGEIPPEGGGAFYSRFTRRLLASYAPFTFVYAPCMLRVRSVYAPCTLRVRSCLHQSSFGLRQGTFGLHQGYLRFTSGLPAWAARSSALG